ncbi:MAG: hypothetical protein U0441_34135 [Polyangiaceae bacterium]
MIAARRAAPIFLGLSAIVVAACGSAKRDECRSLSTLMNQGADKIDKAQATALDPSGLKALADTLDKTATEADALKLTVPELVTHRKSYAALLRDTSKTAREMAAAGEAGDRPKAEAAGDAMEKIVAAEPKLVADVNKACAE